MCNVFVIDRVFDLLGFNSDDLVDQSVFNYHHALDSEDVEKAYKNRKFLIVSQTSKKKVDQKIF